MLSMIFSWEWLISFPTRWRWEWLVWWCSQWVMKTSFSWSDDDWCFNKWMIISSLIHLHLNHVMTTDSHWLFISSNWSEKSNDENQWKRKMSQTSFKNDEIRDVVTFDWCNGHINGFIRWLIGVTDNNVNINLRCDMVGHHSWLPLLSSWPHSQTIIHHDEW